MDESIKKERKKKNVIFGQETTPKWFAEFIVLIEKLKCQETRPRLSSSFSFKFSEKQLKNQKTKWSVL
jgi:hypothetical protein